MEEVFPPDYIYALTSDEVRSNWPNLSLEKNFLFKSKKRKGHNCLGWAIDSPIKDLDMLVFRNLHNLDPLNLDHSIGGYAEILSQYYDFEICIDDTIEDDYD